jgi:hypothetical protein
VARPAEAATFVIGIALDDAPPGQDGEVLPNQLQPDEDASNNRRFRLLAPGFNLAGHFCAFGGMAGTGIAVGIWLVRHGPRGPLWIVPAYLLVANVVEYLMHRFLMHRPLWPRTLYRGHTLQHHRAFHHDSMAIESWREIELVMMPWFTIALFFAVLSPVVVVVERTLGSGAAGWMLLTAIGSFLSYEGLHTLYHLPPALIDRIGLRRSRLFQALFRHHQHHHRLARMRWVNFNVSLPLFDKLTGTKETEAAWVVERERRRAALLVEPAAKARPSSG